MQKWKKGNGEMIGFAIAGLVICSIFLIMVSFLQLSVGLNSISKALITTAAGLIIAAPAIALYFIIKNRIMKLASLVEVEVENVITTLYLEGDSTDMNTPGSKEEKHETKL